LTPSSMRWRAVPENRTSFAAITASSQSVLY
jgi:hypothetical protein